MGHIGFVLPELAMDIPAIVARLSHRDLDLDHFTFFRSKSLNCVYVSYKERVCCRIYPQIVELCGRTQEQEAGYAIAKTLGMDWVGIDLPLRIDIEKFQKKSSA